MTASAGTITFFHLLSGDANGDRWVDVLDFVMLRPAIGGSGPGGPGLAAFDFDGDVDALDFLQFRHRFGTSVP